MTDFRRGLRPRVLTHQSGDHRAKHVKRNSGEHEVIGIRRLFNASYLKGFRKIQAALGPCSNGAYHRAAALHSEN
jgi:hypothetical protein